MIESFNQTIINFTYQQQNTCQIVYQDVLQSVNKFPTSILLISGVCFLFLLGLLFADRFVKNEVWHHALSEALFFGGFVTSAILFGMLAIDILHFTQLVWNLIEGTCIVITGFLVFLLIYRNRKKLKGFDNGDD